MSWAGGDPDCPHFEVIYPLQQDCPCGARFVQPPAAPPPGQLVFDVSATAEPPGSQQPTDKEVTCPPL